MSSSSAIQLATLGVSYLDEPATTSSTTYKTQWSSSNGTAIYGQNGSEVSSIILLEIGA
jgi:hypothetical protein